VGQLATVRGKVANVSATNTGSITFIDFAGSDRRRFTAIVRKDRLADVAAQFAGDLNAGIVGKTVEIRGKLEFYKDTPEIVVTRADQINVLAE
jgi:DNA/RNA endonuclease YhcR with UshA esterase domain